MDIGFIYKIAAIGIITAVLNQVLQKAGKEEYTTLTTIAGLVLVILMLLPKISLLGDELSQFFSI